LATSVHGRCDVHCDVVPSLLFPPVEANEWQMPARLTFVAVAAAARAGLDALHRDRIVLYRAAPSEARPK
jgi:hypothetical protein